MIAARRGDAGIVFGGTVDAVLLLPLATLRAIIHAMPRSSQERIAQSGESHGHPTDRLDLSVRRARVRGKPSGVLQGFRVSGHGATTGGGEAARANLVSPRLQSGSRRHSVTRRAAGQRR
jgi:hypothetical protein